MTDFLVAVPMDFVLIVKVKRLFRKVTDSYVNLKED